ncbi:glycosyltransferase family 2 protein [Actinotalea sp. C106]|uniref:glycosyltransferase family 2 protein n=1 Tax=Actinotalea sp. C106 TaxID=2908644 RepID=UPI002028BDAF|nr:glycosyltransferase family 2 protein [Actinotalea sp. C106]
MRPTSARAVVVTWNGADMLPPCLDSLLAQVSDVELEVLVVDNASDDGTTELLRDRYPQVQVTRNGSNLGFAGGAAVGCKGYDGDLLLLLNNDATLAPDALQRMADALRAPGAQRVAAVTAKILLAGRYLLVPDDGGPLPHGAYRHEGRVALPSSSPEAVLLVNSTGNVLSREGSGLDRDWLVTDGQETGGPDVLGFCGGAAVLRRAALDQVGGFDPDLFLYYEDTDLSLRLRAAGWTVRYESGAVAVHRHAASSGTGSPVFRYYNTRNSLIVLGRHAPLGLVLRSTARQVLGLVAAVVRRETPAVRRARCRGLWHATRRLPRTLRERRRTWRGAQVSRREVGRLLR